MSSAETEMAIVPLKEVHLISNPPLTDAHVNIPPPPVAIPYSPAQVEALRVFEDLNTRSRDPYHIVILRKESTNVFSIRTFSRQDKEAISRHLPGTEDREYQVSDDNRSERIKLTSTIEIPHKNVVMIADSEVRDVY